MEDGYSGYDHWSDCRWDYDMETTWLNCLLLY